MFALHAYIETITINVQPDIANKTQDINIPFFGRIRSVKQVQHCLPRQDACPAQPFGVTVSGTESVITLNNTTRDSYAYTSWRSRQSCINLGKVVERNPVRHVLGLHLFRAQVQVLHYFHCNIHWLCPEESKSMVHARRVRVGLP